MSNPYSLTTNERETLRTLAGRMMELAALPVMKDRIRQWTAVKDLKAERPMVLFEVGTVENFIEPEEYVCRQNWLRYVEWEFRRQIREVEELDDDLVVEPVFRMGYDISGDGYGIDLPAHHATDVEGGSVGYTFDHPIQTPDDVKRLRPQTWTVDRESSRQKWETLSEALDGIMPVTLHGHQYPHVGMTNDVFKLLGNERLHLWPYDEPEALQEVMHYMSQDRIRFHQWMETEGLLGPNNNSAIVGSGSPGYVTGLPVEKPTGETKLKDVWVWSESQETVAISPTMFKDLFLPHIAAASNLFGLVYYACCEPVHDRWDYLYGAIPNIRAVSVSPWCDQKLIASKLGKKVVFSRKPAPGPISGTDPDWNALEKDLDATLDAAKDCNLEIIFRDVYRTHGDRARLARWVQMVRSRVGN
jgi:hypothetical protein